jgi:hypothetical protein
MRCLMKSVAVEGKKISLRSGITASIATGAVS